MGHSAEISLSYRGITLAIDRSIDRPTHPRSFGDGGTYTGCAFYGSAAQRRGMSWAADKLTFCRYCSLAIIAIATHAGRMPELWFALILLLVIGALVVSLSRRK